MKNVACACTAGAQTLSLGSTEVTQSVFPVVEKVLKEAGIPAKISVVPQARLFSDIVTGGLDGAFFLGDQALANLKGVVKVPVKLFQTDLVAVTVGPKPKITSVADLKGLTIGVVRGNGAAEALTKGLDPTLVVNDLTQIKMLAGGRFQVALVSRTAVPLLAQEAGVTNLVIQEPSLLTSAVYFVFSSQRAAYY
jgi:ABC-type amino acid transport substrate-binding protein